MSIAKRAYARRADPRAWKHWERNVLIDDLRGLVVGPDGTLYLKVRPAPPEPKVRAEQQLSLPGMPLERRQRKPGKLKA